MKKQAYFTAENIDLMSAKLLAMVKPFRQKRFYQFVPKNSALLIIDMQNFFLNSAAKSFIPSMPAIVEKIKSLQNTYLKHNFFVLQTKHVDTDDKNKLMVKWWQSVITDDLAANIIPELINNKIRLLYKSEYDAFLHTDLEEQLKKNNIKQVVITGVMTNLCCETTARSAFMRGFEVFFTIDGTAANNKAFHKASLLNLSYGFAVPVLINEVLSWVNGTS